MRFGGVCKLALAYCLVWVAADCAQAQEALEEPSPQSRFIADITGYYSWTEIGTDPAFGSISPIAGPGIDDDSHSIHQTIPELEGGGLRISAQSVQATGWFTGLAYSGFFTDARESTGSSDTDTDRVQANLLDGTLADSAALNGDFEDHVVDFASDEIEIDQHTGDLVIGRRGSVAGGVSGFWYSGLRIANIDFDRDVVYRNLEGAADLDTAHLSFASRMWGVGPTIGGGLDVHVVNGLVLSGSASASALFADFDLSRRDAYFNQSIGDTEIRKVTQDSQDIVPMFDVSVGATQHFGQFYFGLGYSLSMAVGGARSINVNGWDDINDGTSAYEVDSDDIITHAVYARAGLTLGPAGTTLAEASSLLGGSSGLIADAAAYYAWARVGTDPGFGSISLKGGAGIDPNSYALTLDIPELDGGGLRVSVQSVQSNRWFAGLSYSGFFIGEQDSTGSSNIDTDVVHANLLDRTLSDEAGLNDDFDEGEVDFASDEIDIHQHTGDLVLGRRSAVSNGLSGYWHSGIRLAHIDFERDVQYRNFEGVGDTDTANITFGSRMWGLGPTVGGGINVHVVNGLVISGSASASALFAEFDLTRRDAYFNETAGDTEIRQVSLDTQEIVPIFDASFGAKQHFGQFYIGLGYSVTAALGGARSINVNGSDDVNDTASAYEIESDDIIIHSVYARAGLMLGPEGPGVEETASVLGGPTGLVADVTGFYLWTEQGTDPGFARISPITGAGIDPDSNSIRQNLPDVDGGGFRVAVQGAFNNGWFTGLTYSAFFTSGGDSLGSANADTDSVHASLLDRNLADDVAGNLNGDFDDGVVDFASDEFHISQHTGELLLGRRSAGNGVVQGFWHAGLRITHIDLERDLLYQNLEGAADLDTAGIEFRSRMWGAGPTVGGGISVRVLNGLILSGAASASAIYADFDLSRRDDYLDQSAATRQFRDVSVDTQEIVPMFDASLGATQHFGQFYIGVGYTVSAALGGSRTVNISGWDDIDDDTSPYEIDSDDIITHGVFARAGVRFGDD